MEVIINSTCSEETRRNPGGQPGNQNARRHGFYAKTLDAEGERDYVEAKTCVGLEDEIALLRVKIKGVLRYNPHNLKLLMMALANLARLLATQRRIAKDDKEGLKEAVASTLKDMELPPGIREQILGN